MCTPEPWSCTGALSLSKGSRSPGVAFGELPNAALQHSDARSLRVERHVRC